MGNSNGIQSFSEVIRMHRDLGYFERNPLLFNELFEQRAEDVLKTSDFIEAIKHLAKSNNKYDIVFRPHPQRTLIYGNFILEACLMFM